MRALVPFAAFAANKWLNQCDPIEACASKAAVALNRCYGQLDPDVYDPEALRSASLSFSLHYVALDRLHHSSHMWRAKPKLHLFQELCEMGRSCPSHCWTYRDEDFGGAVSRYVKRRGGARSFGVASEALLVNFALNHELASLLP